MQLQLEHFLQGNALEIDLTNLVLLSSLLNDSIPMSFLDSGVSQLLDQRKRILEPMNRLLELAEWSILFCVR